MTKVGYFFKQYNFNQRFRASSGTRLLLFAWYTNDTSSSIQFGWNSHKKLGDVPPTDPQKRLTRNYSETHPNTKTSHTLNPSTITYRRKNTKHALLLNTFQRRTHSISNFSIYSLYSTPPTVNWAASFRRSLEGTVFYGFIYNVLLEHPSQALKQPNSRNSESSLEIPHWIIRFFSVIPTSPTGNYMR